MISPPTKPIVPIIIGVRNEKQVWILRGQESISKYPNYQSYPKTRINTEIHTLTSLAAVWDGTVGSFDGNDKKCAQWKVRPKKMKDS